MARTQTFQNIATVSRAGTALDLDWDFTNGGSVGTIRTFANNIPRVASRGLLVEESATNHIRNVEGLGGSGTTAPTNWVEVVAGTGSSTRTWSIQTINGVRHAVVRFVGTGLSGFSYRIDIDGRNVVAASVGQTWTLSSGFILLAGSIPVTPAFQLRERDATTAPISGATSGTNLTGDLRSHRRFVHTRTLTEATVATINPELQFSGLSGAVDFTIALPLPDLKQRAWASSPIYTVDNTSATTTRVADVMTIPRSAWYNPAGMTLYCDWIGRATVNRAVPVALHKDGNLRHYFYVDNLGEVRLFVWDGATLLPTATLLAFSIGAAAPRRLKSCLYLSDSVVKWVVASETGQLFENYAITPARSLQLTDAALDLKFRDTATGDRQPQDYVRDVRVFPRELTNAQMRDLCRF
jgi:hypothetical protein